VAGVALLLSLGALACARSKAANSLPVDEGASGPFAGPGPLTATLVGSNEIALAWRHRGGETGGYWVEFATPGSDFVKLDVAWPERTAFSHPDLAPGTTFLYRVVPFFGRTSPVVTTFSGPATLDEALESEGPLEVPEAELVVHRALRAPPPLAEAAPAELRVTLAAATAILRWSDRAVDEDGYLVELAQGSGAFEVCALLPANTTSFRKVSLPPASELHFRVRAFYLGEPSNVASADTPE
jgi:hypothetical protein